MSIRRDLVIKVSNGSATLDMPLQIYEKDHGIELRFKLMDYKYKYDKDPENILNSNKEDILEAYTTIINPIGYELAQINGEVIDDTVRFMIEDSYTDELEELGTYQLQIHVKCKHSEFSIPPVRFEVLERLKGEKVVTDGDDEVDYSDIIDGSTKFIDDETGKLIIKWQKGDTISSVRLNAMVEVINNAVDEEAQRQLNEVEREQQELEREQQELERENRLQAALNSVDARVDESMNEYETRFNALTASQQQDMEVIDARDGEVSLKARLDRDLRNPLQVYEDVEDSHISCDSTEGYAQNVEILGNTIQNADDLTDIRSVGEEVEGQELYKISVLSTNGNLFNRNNYKKGGYYISTGFNVAAECYYSDEFINIKPNTTYHFLASDGSYKTLSFIVFYNKNKNVIDVEIDKQSVTSPSNAIYMRVSPWVTVMDSDNPLYYIGEEQKYTQYQEDKLTILSPVQLEKVGDAVDRLICKDGVWGVEKNVDTVVVNGSESWVPVGDNTGNTMLCYTEFNAKPVSTMSRIKLCISDKFPSTDIELNTMDIEGIYTAHDGNICIRINKTKLSTENTEGFVAWLQANNVMVKYQTATSSFIPLPHDQQVKLRTFAGKTNIHFETEIEGIIKAQIPQSISTTISTHTEQIDNLNKELNRVKKLEESTVSTVTTESNFTTVTETTNGYFEDVKLEGKTLVNLIMRETVSISGRNGFISGDNDFGKSNGVYSLTSKVDGNSMIALRYEITFPNLLDATNHELSFCLDSPIDSVYQCTFVDEDGKVNEYESCVYKAGKIHIRYKLPTNQKIQIIRIYVDKNGISTNTSTTFNLTDVMILEGDHTQNPPEYFEGLKSVGDGVDEISVLSVGKNLFNKNTINLNSHIDSQTGGLISNTEYNVSDFIPVKPNTRYTRSVDRYIYYYDYEYNYISYIEQNNPSPSNAKYCRLRLAKDRDLDKFQFEEGTQITPYQKYFSDKKTLLYYNPTTETWEKPILREWDSIEKHADGKYYYHKRSEEHILNANSDEWLNGSNTSDTILEAWDYELPNAALPTSYTSPLICDKFKVESSAFTENIAYSSTASKTIVIRIDKSKAQDINGFKSWLQANPVTVVYQLAQEEVYECINIDLLTYENETNFIVNTGAISPKSTLKVICNITNVVRELQQKVSNLENYIQHVMIDALNNALNE